jgi:hypothetical protein
MALVPLVALLVLGLLVPAPSVAKTSVTKLAASNLLVHTGTNLAPSVTVVKHGLLKVPAATVYQRAGAVAAGASGVAGTTRRLAACVAGPCNDSFRGAAAVRLIAGDYAAWIELALTQPIARGTAFGFAVEFAVEVGSSWSIITGYFSSGTTTARAGQTVDLNLLIDLGTRTLPSLAIVDVTLSACATAGACP